MKISELLKTLKGILEEAMALQTLMVIRKYYLEFYDTCGLVGFHSIYFITLLRKRKKTAS